MLARAASAPATSASTTSSTTSTTAAAAQASTFATAAPSPTAQTKRWGLARQKSNPKRSEAELSTVAATDSPAAKHILQSATSLPTKENKQESTSNQPGSKSHAKHHSSEQTESQTQIQTTRAESFEEEIAKLSLWKRTAYYLHSKLTDNDWSTAAKVTPREEFLTRIVQFYQDNSVITALLFSLSVSALLAVPDQAFAVDDADDILRCYVFCMWISSCFTLLSLLTSLMALNLTQKIPADYGEMLWFADAAMPLINALIIIPFRLGVFFFMAGLSLVTFLAYSALLYDSVWTPVYIILCSLPLLLFVGFFVFRRWFSQQVTSRLGAYAAILYKENQRRKNKSNRDK